MVSGLAFNSSFYYKLKRFPIPKQPAVPAPNQRPNWDNFFLIYLCGKNTLFLITCQAKYLTRPRFLANLTPRTLGPLARKLRGSDMKYFTLPHVVVVGLIGVLIYTVSWLVLDWIDTHQIAEEGTKTFTAEIVASPPDLGTEAPVVIEEPASEPVADCSFYLASKTDEPSGVVDYRVQFNNPDHEPDSFLAENRSGQTIGVYSTIDPYAGGALLIRSDRIFQLGRAMSDGPRDDWRLLVPTHRVKLDADDLHQCQPLYFELVPTSDKQVFWFSTLRTLDI